MARIFYVDIPDAKGVDDPDNSWIHVATFDSKEEAVELVRVAWGVSRVYADVFITEGDDGREEVDGQARD